MGGSSGNLIPPLTVAPQQRKISHMWRQWISKRDNRHQGVKGTVDCRSGKNAIVNNDQARSEQAKGMGELDIIRCLQGVGRSDWRDRYPHVKCREHDEGVIDTIRGED